MEAVSKKRGRPSKFTEEEAAELRWRFPDVSERRRQDLFYADKAAAVLRRLIEIHTARDPDEGHDFVGGYEWILLRQGILVELGRILGKDWTAGRPGARERFASFVEALTWLEEHRPGTRRAVAVLRRHRTNTVASASERELAIKLARTIVDYRDTHPGVDGETVLRALNAVRSTLATILGS